ncbi:MAG: hypothetical protein Tsb0017_11180 [Geothermobacteraceae bacterium]
MKFWVLMSVSLLVTACAPALPPQTMSRVDTSVKPSDAAKNGQTVGKTLLAGGVVLEVETRDDATWIEILDWKLDIHGEPVAENPAGLRYYVVANASKAVPSDLKGRLLTLAGTARKPITVARMGRNISYPVLELVDWRIWPRPVDYHPDRLGPAHSPSWRGGTNPRNPYDSGYAPYPWSPGQLRP